MTDRYKEYLKSGEWKHLKGKKLKQVNYTCEGCGTKGIELDVHHNTYDRIGMELLTDLNAYCRMCHEKIHNNIKPNQWNDYIKGVADKKPKVILPKDIEMIELLRSI